MKRLLAFFLALLLALTSAVGLHFLAESRIHVDSNAFASWSGDGKFQAREAILQNLTEDTILTFGSSEFQHGVKTPYHPAKVFQNTKFQMMLIGAGFYQSLSHAITLASLGDEVQKKEAILFLSPQWFRKSGVQPEAFASRFSDSHYIAMLKNKHLSPKVKDYMIRRSQELLSVDPSMQNRIAQYNRILYTGDASLFDRVNYRIFTRFMEEKELQTTMMQLIKDRIVRKSSGSKTSDTPDFVSLIDQSIKDGDKHNQGNPFYMDDNVYKRLIRPSLKKKKNQSVNGSYSTSPEYEDLSCFLDVCEDLGIRPMLVMLPVNGYWYDYPGFPKEARADYYKKIRTIAKKYHASLLDYSDQEYTKYFFEDGVHIGKKGWAVINEDLYHFYQGHEKE